MKTFKKNYKVSLLSLFIEQNLIFKYHNGTILLASNSKFKWKPFLQLSLFGKT